MLTGQAELSAGYAYTQVDGEVAMVGFADHQHDTKAYVLLQRTLRPSADDVRRGWDCLHVTVDDERRSAYGGVQQIVLRGDRVLIDVSPATAKHLGTGETIVVNIADAQVNADELATMLKLVSGDRVQFSQSS